MVVTEAQVVLEQSTQENASPFELATQLAYEFSLPNPNPYSKAPLEHAAHTSGNLSDEDFARAILHNYRIWTQAKYITTAPSLFSTIPQEEVASCLRFASEREIERSKFCITNLPITEIQRNAHMYIIGRLQTFNQSLEQSVVEQVVAA